MSSLAGEVGRVEGCSGGLCALNGSFRYGWWGVGGFFRSSSSSSSSPLSEARLEIFLC